MAKALKELKYPCPPPHPQKSSTAPAPLSTADILRFLDKIKLKIYSYIF